MAESAAISFDEFSKIRILTPEHFDASSKLKEECKEFISKINEFNTIVGMFQGLLAEKASQIEREKLKTIGMKIQVESEVANRKSRQAQMKSLVAERQAELDRLIVQYDSLVRVQQDQQTFIDGNC
ncbi:hypothetical protein BASA50_003777 [Batrachochytrium salamandrivorans]|uniref:Intraflagellar transport 20 n=1 Tax=Batrachochytrium salamandrivorans TaxID=1357716 RepID=A0ABQ8FEI8_9FUNG|nr:hypothetical protein BASA50_004714 [Batrachochytrium salamandrivorans]KAH6598355.1 hypothetical protein BASA50_003777 [Batrachochytrium salamandrivorans]KAH9248427.1 hypothetical protein BASA81_013921 [Batrachochytrium salamandrivorans]KAJ1342960.1 hypothetical protein BSLG_002467 [Batrachochytrium salamandrivorans]